MTTRSFFAALRMMEATSRMRSGVATDDPPNFKTFLMDISSLNYRYIKLNSLYLLQLNVKLYSPREGMKKLFPTPDTSGASGRQRYFTQNLLKKQGKGDSVVKNVINCRFLIYCFCSKEDRSCCKVSICRQCNDKL
jgi:hypothetical protein